MDTGTLVAPIGDDANSATARPERRPRRLRRRAVLVGLGTASVLVLVGLFSSQMDASPTLLRPVLIGKPAPVFELRSVDGAVVRSSDFVGRPYVVNIWATWFDFTTAPASVARSGHKRGRPAVGPARLARQTTIERAAPPSGAGDENEQHSQRTGLG